MKLEIDAGNSLIKWRVCRGDEIVERGSSVTAGVRQGGELLLPHEHTIKKVRLCSVAGEVATTAIERQVETTWHLPVWRAAVSEHACGVRCGYLEPSRLGVDRWLAVIAGFRHVGGSAIVVDAGSALTIDLVDDSGQHRGGYIMSGQRLMLDALWRGTHAVKVTPTNCIKFMSPGLATEDAVVRGVLLMIVAAIERVACAQPGRLLITGGDANLIGGLLECPNEVVPDLVLDGLNLLATEHGN